MSLATLLASLVPLGVGPHGSGRAATPVDHLVVSEVVTGGASASDELIELHNPTATPLPLEGLEVVYATASGATVTRRAAWSLGAPSVPPGGHVLVANEAGIYAPIADALYLSGMATTGGSVALRIQGASTAIDALGWGTAASTWLEGTPASAPAAGSSLERLPGGALGSGTDTDDNVADFAPRSLPEPQNLLSPSTPHPTAPTPTLSATDGPVPTAVATPAETAATTTTPTPTPSLTPSPTPAPAISTVGEARAAPDGTSLTVEAVALTGADFHDGGGYVADSTGGIAVLATGGGFERGQVLRITGEIDNRFSQRTIRADASDITALGPGAGPSAAAATTGAIGEAAEGRLVRIDGTVLGPPATLTAGLAFDVDDGSGAVRVIVGSATGIATDGWRAGVRLELVGVVGQRDSTGSGTDGYRVQLRDPSDVITVTSPTPSPEPTPSPGAATQTPAASPPPAGVSSIAAAREGDTGSRVRVRGVLTLGSGLVDEDSAVIQDDTAAILLRLGDDAGGLRLGTRVEVSGTRSTLSGMSSIRVSQLTRLGSAAEPAPAALKTGVASEAMEARLVVARGALVASARRSSSGAVSFEIDDGSGPLRVSLASSLKVDRTPLIAGTWVEVRGVLGQQTTRKKPNEGYRLWPRRASEVRVVAPATEPSGSQGSDAGSDLDAAGPDGGGPTASLGDIGTAGADLAGLRVGATLVHGRWPELGIGGLLWDGERLVAVHAESAPVLAGFLRGARVPVGVDLGGLTPAGTDPVTGAATVRLGTAAGDVVAAGPAAAPRPKLDGTRPAWVVQVGALARTADGLRLTAGEAVIAVEVRCRQHDGDALPGGTVSVTGVAVADGTRLLVPCRGIRAAPSVVTGTLAAARGPRAPTGPSLDLAPAGSQLPADPRRPAVAVVLLAAAAVLVGGALWRRRGAIDEAKAPSESHGAVDDPAHAPRLTLVPSVRDGGPTA